MNETISADSFEKRVQKKAYEFYVKREYVYGQDWRDWFEAEKAVANEIDPVEKDCIRSESLYAVSHRLNPLPSGIDVQRGGKND
jgi:hypothetical protein